MATLKRIFQLISILFCLISTAQQTPTWCVVPSTVHVLQNDTCDSLGSVASTEFVVHAMQGEEENQQLLIDTRGWGADQNLTNKISLEINSFQDSNRNEVEQEPETNWWQVGYVYCKSTTRYPGSGGGWKPDPLLSPENGAIYLESEITQPLWISVKVPHDIPAGKYSSNVIMTITTTHTGSTVSIPVTLVVWNIQLPTLAKAKFPAIFSFSPSSLTQVYGNRTKDMTIKFRDLLLDQRIGGNDLYTRVPTNLTEAKYLADAGLQWISLFDVYGATSDSKMKDSRVQGACVNFTKDLIDKAIQILTPAVKSAEQMNILDNLFVYGFDEAPASCEPSIHALYTAIKQQWKNLRTVATVNWLPDTDVPMDVWVLQYEEYNEEQAKQWSQAGKQQWWYHCIEPSGAQYLNTFIERPQLQARLLFWLASAHNVSGWLYYSVVMWKRYPESTAIMKRLDGTARTDFDPGNYIWYPRTDIFANGDGNFVYPGVDGPIPTVRLHNLRDGFEDAEMFRKLPLGKVSPIVEPLVRSATDFTLDAKLFESQREKVAQLII